MHKSGFKSLACGIALLASISAAHAQENDEGADANHIAVGVGLLLQKSPFNSSEVQALPLPMISVKQGAFYVETAEAGIRLNDTFGSVSPSIGLFVAARSPSGQDREKLTADAGGRISLATKFGTLSGEIRHDISGKFDGCEMGLRYSYPISTGKLTITPSVQASWLDRKTANYMYGVTSAQRAKMIEKKRSVILPVAPITEDAHNLGADISMALQLSDRLMLIGIVGGTYLDKSIHRSPAIDQKWDAQAVMGISYRF
jgi:outer membrane scaffolding protein for murein synthesis (MipA/OmpV family)